MKEEVDPYYVAEVFTWLLWHVNPTIDKATTFELVAELLNKGLDKRSVKKYGRLINKTAQVRKSHNGQEVH